MDIKNLTNLTNEILRRLSEWMIKMTKTFSDGSTAVKTVVTDASGNQITSFGSPSTVADYRSPADFTAAFTTSSTLTLSGYNFQLDTGAQIVYIRQRKADTTANVYVNGASGYAFVLDTATGIVTIYKDGVIATILVTGDMYEVGINSSTKAYDPITDVLKSFMANYPVQPISNVLIPVATSVTTDSYFPSADGIDIGYYKVHTFTGILAPATSQVITLTVEGTNAEDLTVAANWQPLAIYNNATMLEVLSLATAAGTSTPFNLKLKECGSRNIRLKLAITVNANANTCNCFMNSIY